MILDHTIFIFRFHKVKKKKLLLKLLWNSCFLSIDTKLRIVKAALEGE